MAMMLSKLRGDKMSWRWPFQKEHVLGVFGFFFLCAWAVCLLENAIEEATMQQIAGEMALSETAYVTPSGPDGFNGSDFNLRWFTPTCEVPLCGHATLATAAVIAFELKNTSDVLKFSTASGVLAVSHSVCHVLDTVASIPSHIAFCFPSSSPLLPTTRIA